MTIILFTTAGCHLCELASEMLSNLNIVIQPIEIGDDDDLVAQYGTRIPVLKFADGSELNWPFEQHDVETKIQQLLT